MRLSTSGELGIALLAGLVLLAAISLLALVATSSMILQQRMAGNFSDGQRARQGAAVAVLKGEALLFSIGHDARIPACRQNCFLAPLDTIIRQASELPVNPEFEAASWWRSWAMEAGTDAVGGNRLGGIWSFGSEPPQFLIEELYFDDLSTAPIAADAPPLEGIGYYRILARGVGLGPAVVAVDEAIIARPWLSEAPLGIGPMDDTDFCTAFKPWYDCGLVAWRQRR